jgi:hypothetical protein
VNQPDPLWGGQQQFVSDVGSQHNPTGVRKCRGLGLNRS